MFYRTIKRIRIQEYLTMQSLAVSMGLSVSTYKNWETGRNLPSFENMMRLKARFPKHAEELEAEFIGRRMFDAQEYFESLRGSPPWPL